MSAKKMDGRMSEYRSDEIERLREGLRYWYRWETGYLLELPKTEPECREYERLNSYSHRTLIYGEEIYLSVTVDCKPGKIRISRKLIVNGEPRSIRYLGKLLSYMLN